MKKFFWNYSEKRLRSGWRIIIFLTGLIISLVTLVFISKMFEKNIIFSIAGLISFGILTIIVLWLGGRYIDHRNFKNFGFNFGKKWWRDFGFGICLAAVLISAIFVAEKALGWINIAGFLQNEKEHYQGLPFVLVSIIALIAYISMILWEEVFFRGYLMKNLSEGLNNRYLKVRGAVISAFILSSAIFGLSHLSNPNMSIFGMINLVTIGIFFGLPYLLTGELAIPIALHLSWNYFQGIIFGFPLSGQPDKVNILVISQNGPELWTGGAFGPEAGLFGLAATLAGCAIILLWIKVTRGSISLHSSLAKYRKNDGK